MKTRLIVLVIMTTVILACGRKGSLYLPEQKSQQKAQQTQSEPDKTKKTQQQESK